MYVLRLSPLGNRQLLTFPMSFGTAQIKSAFSNYFSDIILDGISNRDLSRWVEYERQRGIKDITIRLWSRQFNKICRNAKRLGYYTPVYEWCEWNIKDKPIRYLTDNEEQRILKELDPSSVKDPYHKKCRQAARDIFILMVDGHG
jgi:hypothetical protein